METAFVKVSDVMRTSLHKVDGLASVEAAIQEMNSLGVSSLIIERRHPGDEFGVVSVHEIAAGVIAKNRSAARTSVYEIMAKPALSLTATMNVKYAIRLLARLGQRRALVTDGDELLGFVTLRDLVVSYTDSGTQDPD